VVGDPQCPRLGRLRSSLSARFDPGQQCKRAQPKSKQDHLKCESHTLILTFLWDGLCYVEFFMYSFGNREICRYVELSLQQSLHYRDMQEISYLISTRWQPQSLSGH
jgi:hypothetical protein